MTAPWLLNRTSQATEWLSWRPRIGAPSTETPLQRLSLKGSSKQTLQQHWVVDKDVATLLHRRRTMPQLKISRKISPWTKVRAHRSRTRSSLQSFKMSNKSSCSSKGLSAQEPGIRSKWPSWQPSLRLLTHPTLREISSSRRPASHRCPGDRHLPWMALSP